MNEWKVVGLTVASGVSERQSGNGATGKTNHGSGGEYEKRR